MATQRLASPVQVLIIGFDGPTIPDRVHATVAELRGDKAVRLVDALGLRRGIDGSIERYELPELRPDGPSAEGALRSVLDRARARPVLTEPTLSGPSPQTRGVLFPADPLEDPRDVMPQGSNAVVLLLEHRWGARLREAVAEVAAYPVAGAWLGAAAVDELGLPPPG
jgi:hypothetical protein